MKKTIILLIAVMVSFATFAQTNKSKAHATKSPTAQQAKYTCPMHPDVVSNKPGKCSQCGMTLTKVKTYSCSMHPDVVSDKPGKCTKCGMDLTEVKSPAKTKKS